MEKNTRRAFLRKAGLSSAAMATAPMVFSKGYKERIILEERNYSHREYPANDLLQIGLIGSGIQGIYDTRAALSVPGTRLVAACDLYTGRLDRAKELWGDAIFTTRDYRELLERPDIDVVIIATPDHWHQKIT